MNENLLSLENRKIKFVESKFYTTLIHSSNLFRNSWVYQRSIAQKPRKMRWIWFCGQSRSAVDITCWWLNISCNTSSCGWQTSTFQHYQFFKCWRGKYKKETLELFFNSLTFKNSINNSLLELLSGFLRTKLHRRSYDT